MAKRWTLLKNYVWKFIVSEAVPLSKFWTQIISGVNLSYFEEPQIVVIINQRKEISQQNHFNFRIKFNDI